MADNEGGSSGLSYSVLEEDTATPGPSYNRLGFINSGPARTRTTLSGCLRASVPHLVVIAVYLVYLLAGGGVFLAIYQAQERQIQTVLQTEVAEYEETKMMIGEAVESCAETTHGVNLTTAWERYVELSEDRYLEDVYITAEPELSYMRSVVFCLTTITTIGYGDYVPTTTLGKAATVFYALVGLPLTLLFLVDMGNLLARVVDTLVSRWRCRQLTSSRQFHIYKDTSEPANGNQQDHGGETRGYYWEDTAWGRRNVPVFVVVAIWLVFFFLASVFIAEVEDWSYEEGLFFTVTTMTTIGFGDIVPVLFHTDIPSFFAFLVHILSTLTVMSMCVILMMPKVLKLAWKIDSKINL